MHKRQDENQQEDYLQHPISDWILRESEVFICKAFKGDAIMYYLAFLLIFMQDSGS